MQTTIGPKVLLPGAKAGAEVGAKAMTEALAKAMVETMKKTVKTVPIVNQEKPVQHLMTPEQAELIRNTDWGAVCKNAWDEFCDHGKEIYEGLKDLGNTIIGPFVAILNSKAEE